MSDSGVPPGAVRPGTWAAAPAGSLLARLRDRAGCVPGVAPLTPAETRGAVGEFCRLHAGVESGPAHVVLADFNLEPYCVGLCIRGCLAESGAGAGGVGADTIDFLAALLCLDDGELFEPDDEGGGD